MRLPDGLHFGALDPVRDAKAIAWLFWQGFDHGSDRAEFERQDEAMPQVRRHFRPELGVTVMNEANEPVACCVVWVYPDTDYAYVEPVCTIPAYRGMGVGKAVVYEALNRARTLGAKCAYVISDQVFYEKSGFVFDSHYTFYRKA